MQLPLCKSEWPSFITMAPLRYSTLSFSSWFWPSWRPELTRQRLSSALAASPTIWQPSIFGRKSVEKKKVRCDQGQKPVLVNEIPAKSASSSLGLPSEEGERWALGDLYQPCCSPDLTERKHKQVESGGSLEYGEPQIFTFRILNVFTNSKCVR